MGLKNSAVTLDEKVMLKSLGEMGNRDIAAMLLKYGTANGPVYVIFDIEKYAPNSGFLFTYEVMIPEHQLIIIINETNKDIRYILNFIKEVVWDNPKLTFEFDRSWLAGEL